MIILGILLPTSICYSQHVLVVDDKIGGSGTTTPQGDNSSDNTTLYVVGALVIGGIVVYSLLKENKDKSDSSDIEDKSALIINNKFESFSTKLQKAKNSIPVDLILGVRNEKSFISEKTYLFGVSFRF